MKVLVVHGPNLNLLGRREKTIYGTKSLTAINKEITGLAKKLAIDVRIVQRNGEGDILDIIQKADYDALIINPAAFFDNDIPTLYLFLRLFLIPEVGYEDALSFRDQRKSG